MWRALSRRWADERGIAIITAMLVSMIIVTLGTTSVTLAIHNSEASAFDRRRVQAVAASEAGINFYFSHLQSGGATSFACSISRTMTTTPASRFDATVKFYNAAGVQMPCPITGTTKPAAASIRSVGSVVGTTSPRRTMESYVKLTGRPDSPFVNSVIYANSSVNWPANVQVQGSDLGATNVHINGNATFGSNIQIYGAAYVQGSLTMNGSSQVRRDAWANGAIVMKNSATVLGKASSSTSSITLQNAAKVYGDAQAGTSITAGTTAIGGRRVPNSPQVAPPVGTFPAYTFTASDWTGKGYTVQTFTGTSACTNAKNFMQNNIASGNYVIRITTDCALSFSKETLNVRGNLAIVSDGGIALNTNTKINAVGGPWNLHLIFGIDNDGAPCDISLGSNTNIGANLWTFFYTPCNISLASNAFVNEGQLFGGGVALSSNSGIKFRAVPVPGYDETYKEDIVYIREVVTGS